MFKKGDKVLVKAVIVEVDEDDFSMPYEIATKISEADIWVSGSELIEMPKSLTNEERASLSILPGITEFIDEEIATCPFCGERVHVVEHGGKFRAECTDCSYIGKEFVFAEDAIKFHTSLYNFITEY